jgi:hypothetical protein
MTLGRQRSFRSRSARAAPGGDRHVVRRGVWRTLTQPERREGAVETMAREVLTTLHLMMNVTLVAAALMCTACGGATASIEADAGRDAAALRHDSGTHQNDSAASGDVAKRDTKDGGESDACPTLPPDAGIQCGKPCAFPGYFSPCPPDLGDPIGVSCMAVVDGGVPIWLCSEG